LEKHLLTTQVTSPFSVIPACSWQESSGVHCSTSDIKNHSITLRTINKETSARAKSIKSKNAQKQTEKSATAQSKHLAS
jgi:hypothetical protein